MGNLIEFGVLNGLVLLFADLIYPVAAAQAFSSFQNFFMKTLVYGVPLMMVSAYVY